MARWALVSAEGGEERAACALRAVEALRASGARVGGFVQGRGSDPAGRTTFELVHLSDGARVTLAIDGVAAREPAEEFFCSMAFRTAAFDAARAWIERDAATCDVLVVDGVGKLEAAGRGHAGALRAASQAPLVVACIRASQLSAIVERFELSEPAAALELPASPEAEEDFRAAVVEMASERRSWRR